MHGYIANPIIKITTVGCIIETVRSKNAKITSYNRNQHLLLYKLAEQLASGLGRVLECWKCNKLTITQTLMVCLIYTHLPSGAACPQALCIYIRLSNHACVITFTHIHMHARTPTHTHTHTYTHTYTHTHTHMYTLYTHVYTIMQARVLCLIYTHDAQKHTLPKSKYISISKAQVPVL